MRTELTRLNWFDFALSFMAASLAVYTAGMGLGVGEISWTFIGLLAIGSTFSLGIHYLVRDSWVSRLDGVFFTLGGVASLIWVQQLNAMLPEGGFPRSLIVASFLCWMLVMWSFTMWRDSTLLFPCVPSVALFSLVGSWDSYKGAVFAFFGFLLCFATLFARSQRRTMAFRARDAGVDDLSRLRLGPWKWMAGPEWALGSSAAIVLISLVGAPVLQFSVQGVAGFVKINVPRPRSNPINTPTSNAVDQVTGETRVGRGPIGEMSEVPIMKVRMDSPRYLRVQTFDRYTGRGWKPIQDFQNGFERRRSMTDGSSLYNLGRLSIKDADQITFAVDYLLPINDSLPLPGELWLLDPNPYEAFVLKPDGTVKIVANGPRPRHASGRALVAPQDASPVNTVSTLKGTYTNEFDDDRIPLKVRQKALEWTQGAKSDYEKAMALKRGIESICKYNLKAPAIPSGKDAVETFLYETKEGYCDLFASSMTLLARSVGLPARYVQGYLPFAHQVDELGRYVIHDSDYHAWCEILFEGVGWVSFDATEGAEMVEGGERGRGTQDPPFYTQLWFKTPGGALVLATLAAGGWYGLRRHRAVLKTRSPRREMGMMYESFALAMERAAGRSRRPGETPEEYLDTALPALGEAADEARALTAVFVGGLYSPDEPTEIERQDIKQRVKAFKRSVSRLPKRDN
ncbi:MAG: transglutaminaseTgpA domain-containing protein [Fimbriimonadales bacterium]